MLKIEVWRKILKIRTVVKSLIAVCIVGVGLFLWTWDSSGANRDFAEADDFPRGALVYAQVRDLPALLKTWDESELKKEYLDSANFKEFQKRHLALKLAARWQEFNDALGFELDASALVSAATANAGIAVYDIGKMEMVFVAPVIAEKFAATMFFQNQAQFETVELPDNSVYYSRAVEADRGRQRQKILFANSSGRFVLATSESLLLRTLANINRKSAKDRLSDEPAFAELKERISPHLATVWVDQTRLNEDYYFKRYWLMRNQAELKTIRAGIFDFEMQNDKLIERREFLLVENKEFGEQAVSATEAARLQSFVSIDAAYFRLQTVAEKPQRAASLIGDAIADRSPTAKTPVKAARWSGYDSFEDAGEYRSDDDYYRLGSKFNEAIDETDETAQSNENNQRDQEAARIENRLAGVLTDARASAAITVFSVTTLDAPLFAEFQRTTIFSLNSPEELDRQTLENALSAIATRQLAVRGEKFNFGWSDGGNNDNTWRELKIPLFKREILYAVRDSFLIVANDAELMQSLLLPRAAESPVVSFKPFNKLSVIRLDQRATAFDAPMNRLAAEANKHTLQSEDAVASTDFFTGNIASLLTTIKQAKLIEIKRSTASDVLSEEVVVALE